MSRTHMHALFADAGWAHRLRGLWQCCAVEPEEQAGVCVCVVVCVYVCVCVRSCVSVCVRSCVCACVWAHRLRGLWQRCAVEPENKQVCVCVCVCACVVVCVRA